MAWPDVLKLTVDYLTPIVAPVAVASRVPEDSAPRLPLVQIRRVGGIPEVPVRDSARLDVFCWHETDAGAWDLAADVRGAMWALSGTDLLGPMCYRVEETLGPTQTDDERSHTPRVWATYQLDVRADDAIRP